MKLDLSFALHNRGSGVSASCTEGYSALIVSDFVSAMPSADIVAAMLKFFTSENYYTPQV